MMTTARTEIERLLPSDMKTASSTIEGCKVTMWNNSYNGYNMEFFLKKNSPVRAEVV